MFAFLKKRRKSLKKPRLLRRFAFFVFTRKSVGEESDLVLRDFGYDVADPCDRVSDTGRQSEDAGDQGNDVLRLKITADAVDAADDVTEEDLKQDLGDLGQFFVFLCHGCSPFFKILKHKVE